MKLLRALALMLLVILVITGCTGEQKKSKIYGTWETGPMIPKTQDPQDLYYPTKTKLTISEKYLYFFDSIPMKYESKVKGDTIKIKLNKEDFFLYDQISKIQYQAGNIPDERLTKRLSIECSLKDSNIMECTYLQYWNGSTLGPPPKIFSKMTRVGAYDNRTVMYKRVVPAK